MINYGISPLTIVKDKYSGKYCKGGYIAWNLEPNEIPKYSYSNETSVMHFWNSKNYYDAYREYDGYFGIGETIQEAIDDLYSYIIESRIESENADDEDFDEIIEDVHLV